MLRGMSKSLLDEIEAAAARMGIAPATLCKRAVENSALPRRLAAGGSVTLITAERIKAWIKANRSRKAAP